MSNNSLMGKKVAVLVESEFVPSEIRAYQDRFAALEMRVDLISRLWGNPKLTFVSDVEKAGETPQTLDVTIDIDGFPGVVGH